MHIETRIEPDADGRYFAQVEIGGVRFTIHQSLVDPEYVNVEVDHQDGVAPLRIHVNDGVVFDSAGPAQEN